ncbi:glycosyltransferase [Pelotomaculum propionicicum]|uniref:glycosyltransferase n=1 Tax=Pelotomaculum propionicicum TaxID=258475 RepID=UPI003B7BABD0
MISIIVPTFNEKGNVFKIAERISKVLSEGIAYEIIFVDDSTDETPEILDQLARLNHHVRYIHRAGERGLGTAVVRGFELAQGEVIAVMDADLQHPPEMIMPMLKTIESGVDIVIPSRFVPGGDDGGLNIIRKFISATARYTGKFMLKALRGISDPTSGFFMFRQSVIRGILLKPIGWKILIEVLVKGNYENVVEIPYHFKARAAGESKMSLKEQRNYLYHLVILTKDSPVDRRFYLFALVGLSGMFLNMSVYTFLYHMKVNVALAGTISAFVAMISNFILNDRYTWSEIRESAKIKRFCKFLMTSSVGAIIDVNILSVLYYVFHINYFLANILGILSGTLWNFTINNIWTWQKTDKNKKIINKLYY